MSLQHRAYKACLLAGKKRLGQRTRTTAKKAKETRWRGLGREVLLVDTLCDWCSGYELGNFEGKWASLGLDIDVVFAVYGEEKSTIGGGTRNLAQSRHTR